MNRVGIITAAMFGAVALSAVLMFKTGLRVPPDPRTVLGHWPQEVAQALDVYDLDKLADYFVDEFHDQDGTNKQTYKAFLLLDKNHPIKWKAVVKSTQVEWDSQVPLEAKLQVNFEISKMETRYPLSAELFLRKIDDDWKGVSVRLEHLEAQEALPSKDTQDKSAPPK